MVRTLIYSVNRPDGTNNRGAPRVSRERAHFETKDSRQHLVTTRPSADTVDCSSVSRFAQPSEASQTHLSQRTTIAGWLNARCPQNYTTQRMQSGVSLPGDGKPHNVGGMTGRIDVHSHLLPGVDDGCATLAHSIECAKTLVANGYTHSFCTPHIWPSFPAQTRDSIAQWTAALQLEFDAAGVALRLIPGGEHNFSATFMHSPPERVVPYGLTSKYVLADMWADKIPSFFEPSVKWLQSMGLTVILAHPERMRAVQDKPELADYFADLGLLLQGNLQCFSDPPHTQTRQVAERYLLEGRYFLLGSDTHKPDTIGLRMRGIEQAIEIAGQDVVERLMMENPRKLLP